MLTYEMANHIERQVRRVDLFLRETKGFVDVGFGERLMNQIMAHYFDVDVATGLSAEPNRRIGGTKSAYRDWDYEKMKESCIQEVIKMIQCGATRLTEIVCATIMRDSLLVENRSTGSKLDELVLGAKKVANRCLYESISIARGLAAPQNRLVVASLSKRSKLLYGEMFDVFVKGATNAHRTRLNRLFGTHIITGGDTSAIYDLISLLLQSMPIFVPLVENECRFDTISIEEGETIGQLRKRLIEIRDKPPVITRLDRNRVELRVLKFFRLVHGDAADMTHTDELDETGLTPASNYTVLLYYEVFEWCLLETDRKSLFDVNGRTACLIEHCRNGTVSSFESRTLGLSVTPFSVASLRHSLPSLLMLGIENLARFEFHFTRDDTAIMITVNDDGQQSSGVHIGLFESPLDRLVRLLCTYEARTGEEGTRYVEEAVSLEPAEEIHDQDVVVPIEVEDNDTPVTRETYDLLAALYQELRGLLYLSTVVLRPKLQSMRVPYVERGNVTQTILVDVKAGLFNGVLELRDQVTGEIRRITVDRLILEIEQSVAWLSNRKIRVNILAIT